MTAPVRRQLFDDTWFIQRRARLLHPFHKEVGRRMRAVASLHQGAALIHRPGDKTHEATERALTHLASRHATATRAHMQFYRACLESTGLVPADRIMAAAVQIEWFWYTTPFKGFYRDHLAHVMKVALTALELLLDEYGALAEDTGTGPPRPLIHRVAEGLSTGRLGTDALRMAARRFGNEETTLHDPAFWRDAVLEATKLAGLLHDLAYPSMMASKVLKAAAPVHALLPLPMGTPDTTDTLARAVARLGSRLLTSPFRGGALGNGPLSSEAAAVCAHVLEMSHSLRAGLAILEYGAHSDEVWRLSPFEAFVVDWAAHAAALHDYDKLYEERPKPGQPPRTPLERWLEQPANVRAVQPSFRRDPVCYLVALADQLQDFGRMNYHREPTNAGADTDQAPLRIRYPWHRVELSVEGARARLAFHLAPPDATGCFGVAPGDRTALRDRKLRDATAIFGARGWLDHEGLFEEVELLAPDSPLALVASA
ncbi:MAG TPA: hypothetical protein VH877_21985 [Polyangia bacterium]|jgi:hypothetical protein|nr:hypothetical protein [Polyangia bacterium]